MLLPTFTYVAYSCERAAPAGAGSGRPEDRWVARNRLASLYDRHEDGVGVYEATLRRPLTQLRPAYRCAQHGGPHGLAQDLILLGFLERNGIEVDHVTDHDLDADGAAALAGHRTVITGAHPEYASEGCSTPSRPTFAAADTSPTSVATASTAVSRSTPSALT